MPSRPVAARRHSRPAASIGLAGPTGMPGTPGLAWAGPAPRASASALAAQPRLTSAQTATVRSRPRPGTSQKAVASTPSTAPKVLLAYRPASGVAPACRWANSRSSAGSVAPIAAVAGSSAKKVPAKATAHCQAGLGWAPVRASSAWLKGARPSASSRLQRAISNSQPAYQRAGCGLRRMRAASRPAPTARPPKKADTTASTAAASWPSHSATCWVQTTW